MRIAFPVIFILLSGCSQKTSDLNSSQQSNAAFLPSNSPSTTETHLVNSPTAQSESTLADLLLRRLDREEQLLIKPGFGVSKSDLSDWQAVVKDSKNEIGPKPGLQLLNCKLLKWQADQETEGKYDRPDEAIECIKHLLRSPLPKNVEDTARFWLLDFQLRAYESDVPFEIQRSNSFLDFAQMNTTSSFRVLAKYKAVIHGLDASSRFHNPDQRSGATVTDVTTILTRIRPSLVELLNDEGWDSMMQLRPESLSVIDRILLNPTILNKKQ